MKVRGYVCEAEWDGSTLTMRGTNRVGWVALRGDGARVDVVVPRDAVTGVVFTPCRMGGMVNGALTVEAGGSKYQLHFRRKQQEGFEALARELGAA